MCRCYCKLGEWHEGLFGLNDSSIPQIISYYAEATKHDKAWYKAWHSFAYLNYEAVLFYKQQKAATEATVSTAGDSAVKSDDARDEVSSLIIKFLVFPLPLVFLLLLLLCYLTLARRRQKLHGKYVKVVTI